MEDLPLDQQMHRCRILVRKFLSKVRFENGEYDVTEIPCTNGSELR